MAQSRKVPGKYWSKRPSTVMKAQSQDSFSLNLTSSSNMASKQQTQKRVLLQNESLRHQNKAMTQQLLKIALKLQKLKGFNSSFNQKFIDPNEQIIELRCPQHNNVIILYCTNDFKLLCANCAFGSQFHKKHAMVEAAKGKEAIDIRLKEIDKILKGTTSNLEVQRVKWEELLTQAQQTKKTAMRQIQKAYENALAVISTKFSKYKNKIEQTYKSTVNTISLNLKCFNSLLKALKYQNPLQNIRHLYMQYAIDQIDHLPKIIPNITIGNNMIRVLDKLSKISVNAFTTLVCKLQYK